MAMENTLFIGNFPIGTFMCRGFSISMFDCWGYVKSFARKTCQYWHSASAVSMPRNPPGFNWKAAGPLKGSYFCDPTNLNVYAVSPLLPYDILGCKSWNWRYDDTFSGCLKNSLSSLFELSQPFPHPLPPCWWRKTQTGSLPLTVAVTLGALVDSLCLWKMHRTRRLESGWTTDYPQ